MKKKCEKKGMEKEREKREERKVHNEKIYLFVIWKLFFISELVESFTDCIRCAKSCVKG